MNKGMIDRVAFIDEMKKALELPESYGVDIEESVCPLTADEIIDPNGFDLKLGQQVFHFNLGNNPNLSEQIMKVTTLSTEVKNEVVSFVAEKKERLRAEEERKLAEDRGEFSINGVSFKMVYVEGGTYTMGATSEQINFRDIELPTHQVTISSFLIGETPVTQDLWEAVMGYNPATFIGENCPVENVSWIDCQDFIEKLNNISGKQFRLPTEAEWEFAARGGINSKGYIYSGGDDPNSVACLGGGEKKPPFPVKSKLKNELGIYDMSGNVEEWCSSTFEMYSSEEPYSSVSEFRPSKSNIGSFRVTRGGSFFYPQKCRVSYRTGLAPECKSCLIGLRLAI